MIAIRANSPTPNDRLPNRSTPSPSSATAPTLTGGSPGHHHRRPTAPPGASAGDAASCDGLAIRAYGCPNRHISYRIPRDSPPTAADRVLMPRFTELETYDVRFPTSRDLDGSDAMNPDPDYSAAYADPAHRRRRRAGGARLRVHDRPRQRRAGRGDRGAPRPRRSAVDLDATLDDLGGFWKALVHDSQLRWLGPEKGVMHMAIGAVVNAVWDLAAKRAGEAAVEAAGRPDAGGDRRARRLPLPDRRAHAATRRWRSCAPRSRAAPSASAAAARARLPGVHDDARLARLRRREARPAVPRGGRRRASPRSSSRSARTWTTTSAGCGSPARRSARTSGSRSTPTSAGTWPRRSSGSRRWRRTTP